MTAQAIRLIVGLGNPGAKYTQTRHNAGFWFVDGLASHFQGQFRLEQKFSAEVARVNILGSGAWLSKPITFMNRSGLAVRQIADFYKIPSDQILVAHDEIDLPPGVAKFKRGGGHGGHNGLRDITSHFGKDFWRLRIGVGHPGHKNDVVDYVLGRASKADEVLIYDSIEAAVSVADLVALGELEKAMNQLHSRS